MMMLMVVDDDKIETIICRQVTDHLPDIFSDLYVSLLQVLLSHS
jgi:hypothetical protein